MSGDNLGLLLVLIFGMAAIVYLHIDQRISELEAANVVVAGVLRELIDILKERNKDSQ